VSFTVRRLCTPGFCPVSDGACDCSDPRVEVDVDELLELEGGWYWQFGTLEQRVELEEYFGPELGHHGRDLKPANPRRLDEDELVVGKPEAA
jgi:hypothetical protein